MRIGHLVSHPSLNGVATSVRTLVQAQLDAGHEVMLVHSNGSWIERQAFKGPATLMASSFKTRPAEIRRVGYALRDWGLDLVHAHGSKGNKYGLVFRCHSRTPTVMTAHARKWQFPWAFAHAVIAPSRPTAEYYLRHRLVRAKNMHVVPHMFETGDVRPVTAESRAAARRSLGLPAEGLVLGSVGELGERKNQVDMIRLLGRLAAAGMDARLLLIGGSPGALDLPDWREALALPGLAGRVHAVGERDDAVAMLHAMDVYLCTSRVEEGPIATLEAMASGLPVLSVDVGYSSELLDGDNGRLFDHGALDAMAKVAGELAADPELRRRMGEAARATIERKLAPRSIVPQVDAVYRAAIQRSGNRASMSRLVARGG